MSTLPTPDAETCSATEKPRKALGKVLDRVALFSTNMTKNEKKILRGLVNSKIGLLDPDDFIGQIAEGDRRAVENLIACGYIEEVPREVNGGRAAGMRTLNFYRATEKGLNEFAPWKSKIWFNLKSQTSLWVGISSIVIGVLSIFISSVVAFGVPWYQNVSSEQKEIEAIYKNLITNEDILISNSNNARYLLTATSVTSLPESFLKDEIEGDMGKILQDKFGLIQYRFFVYYLQQIELLNLEIEEMRSALVVGGSTSTAFLSAQKAYLSTVGEISKEGMDARFSHIRDVECLTYLFERNFEYLSIDPRGKIEKCSNESLNRIYYNFGFLEAATPRWMLPAYRDALNERKAGFGDTIINIAGGY